MCSVILHPVRLCHLISSSSQCMRNTAVVGDTHVSDGAEVPRGAMNHHYIEDHPSINADRQSSSDSILGRWLINNACVLEEYLGLVTSLHVDNNPDNGPPYIIPISL